MREFEKRLKHLAYLFCYFIQFILAISLWLTVSTLIAGPGMILIALFPAAAAIALVLYPLIFLCTGKNSYAILKKITKKWVIDGLITDGLNYITDFVETKITPWVDYYDGALTCGCWLKNWKYKNEE